MLLINLNLILNDFDIYVKLKPPIKDYIVRINDIDRTLA